MLTISGEPTENQLQVAWELILQDYSELINTPKAKSIFDIWMKIVSTKRKLSFIDISIEWLKVGYDAEIAEQLCSLGYDLVQPLTDRAQYLQQLYVIQNEAKLLVVLLNQYVSEYNALSPNDSKIVARTAMDYEKELRILSKFMGYHIKATDITVFEFAGIVNSYIELNKKNGTTI